VSNATRDIVVSHLPEARDRVEVGSQPRGVGVLVVGSGLGGMPEVVDGYGAVAPPLPEGGDCGESLRDAL